MGGTSSHENSGGSFIFVHFRQKDFTYDRNTFDELLWTYQFLSPVVTHDNFFQLY